MQSLVAIYGANAGLIERFILSSLNKVSLSDLTPATISRLFSTFPNLELLYACDEGFTQISPNHYQSREDKKSVGVDRSYLVDEMELDKGHWFSDPYISTTTGTLCVTVVYVTKSGYLFLDFAVRGLLERFDLIEKNDGFKQLNRAAYGLIGSGLIFFGLFVVLYSFYTFGSYLLAVEPLSLDSVFKPVIALTLGLAVFDLGKTIVEEEVLPKTEKTKQGFNAKTLMNFSVSIIIALLIEALLVVFKISISDYRDLPYAAWLIASLALLLFVFAVFIYLMKRGDRGLCDIRADG